MQNTCAQNRLEIIVAEQEERKEIKEHQATAQ
jgi:hypothetical protein